MLTVITRAVSSALASCELSFIPRQPIDLGIAHQQHHAYEKLLASLGARVISLPAEPELPDSMFVEDPAIVQGARIEEILRELGFSARDPGETLRETVADLVARKVVFPKRTAGISGFA